MSREEGERSGKRITKRGKREGRKKREGRGERQETKQEGIVLTITTVSCVVRGQAP